MDSKMKNEDSEICNKNGVNDACSEKESLKTKRKRPDSFFEGTEGASDKESDRVGSMLPKAPKPFVDVGCDSNEFDSGMRTIMSALNSESENKEAFGKLCRFFRIHCENVILCEQSGKPYDMDKLRAHWDEFMKNLESMPADFHGMTNCSSAKQTYVVCECLDTFFRTGKLLSRRAPEVVRVETTDYLCGVIQFLEEIEAYAIERAMWKDIVSVILCSKLVQSVNAALMEFNFRNGFLRKRYDSVKYKERKLENMVYELSIVFGNESMSTKASKDDFLDGSEFSEMVEELNSMDAQREEIIKSVREPQKLSKKAIFSLHRGDIEGAGKLLEISRKTLEQILSDATANNAHYQDVNGNSMSGALEEYAEARLFQEWLSKGSIMSFHDLKDELYLNPTIYLGALADFTGEVGRFCVKIATTRDLNAVGRCLACGLAVQNHAIEITQAVPNLRKKLGAISLNTRKMRNVLYELLLVVNSTIGKKLDMSVVNEKMETENEVEL